MRLSSRKLACILMGINFSAAAGHAQPGADIRARLAAIDYRHAANLSDYLRRCVRIRKLLPELEEFYRNAGATIRRVRNSHPNDPQFVKLGDVVVALNAKDLAGLDVFRHELDEALVMEKLSVESRQQFFDERIRPLQKQEDAISDEEIKIAVDARNQGVPLPEDMIKALRNR